MNATLSRALVASVPVGILLFGSAVLFWSRKTVATMLQLIGAGCLVVVVLSHIAEALHLFPRMQWGDEYSAGHFLDLSSAVLGLVMFPIGYLLFALTKKST